MYVTETVKALNEQCLFVRVGSSKHYGRDHEHGLWISKRLFYSFTSSTKRTAIVRDDYNSFISLSRLIADLTEAAAVVEYVQAPPAMVIKQFFLLHSQMPTAFLFMVSWRTKRPTVRTREPDISDTEDSLTLPQKVHWNLACWVISIFLTVFLREAP